MRKGEIEIRIHDKARTLNRIGPKEFKGCLMAQREHAAVETVFEAIRQCGFMIVEKPE